jgi:hypothetical protein
MTFIGKEVIIIDLEFLVMVTRNAENGYLFK